MNKTVLVLLLALCYASASTQWGGFSSFGKYGGYGGYSKGRWSGGYTGGWENSGGFTGDIDGDVDADYTGGQDDDAGSADSIAYGGAYSCPNAIDNVNRAFDQLIEDVKAKANEWIVYSDLDAIDDVSYYLATSCDVQKLDVVSQGKNGGSGSQACQGLSKLLKALLQQAETGAFRGDYQQGAQLSEQALSIGESVESGCQVRLAQKQQEQQQRQQDQEEQIEEEQIGQPEQHRPQRHEPFVNILYRKLAKNIDQDFSQYGNKIASQYTSKYGSQSASKYNKYADKYGKDYANEGKDMTKLAGSGEGKKYGDDQAALSHKLNKEYTAKYAKDKKDKQNNEEENNLKNEESAFNLNDLFLDLSWM